MPDPENFLNGHQMINHVQFDIPGYASTSVILPTLHYQMLVHILYNE
jgi:hypothetical protein